jgi:hypothetical protein
MFEDDYLLRMVQQLVDAIARIAGLNQRAAHDEALAVARQAWEELFGMPGELVDRVDGATLASMLREPAKLRLAAQLLVEQARALSGQGDAARAASRYCRAMELVLEARVIDPSERAQDDAAIRMLSPLVPRDRLAARYRALV